MNNSFVRKVTAERKVLSVINTVTPGGQQLAGLSMAAIESWRRAADIEQADDLARILLRIAGLCQRLSDRSHETFQTLEPNLMKKIDSELAELRSTAGLDNIEH